MFTTRRLRLRTFDPSTDVMSIAALERDPRRIGSSPFGVASSPFPLPLPPYPFSSSSSSSKPPLQLPSDQSTFEDDIKKRIESCLLYLVIETRPTPTSPESGDSSELPSPDSERNKSQNHHHSSVPKFVGVIGLVGPVSPREGINRAVELFISVTHDAATTGVSAWAAERSAAASGESLGDTSAAMEYAAEAIECVLGYAFGSAMCMHRVGVSSVVEGDERTYDLYRHLGFTEEGRRRKQVWIEGGGGEWKDAIQMGILEEEWLANKRGVHISPAASLISATQIFAPHTPF